MKPKQSDKKKVGRYVFSYRHIIGRGFGGKVYKGRLEGSKSYDYAIKVIRLREMSITQIHMLKNEVEITQALDHPNLVKFVDVYYTAHHCYLVTEYCEGGTLE